MSGLDLAQFKALIVRPVVSALGPGEGAVNLLTGTALVESGLVYLVQIRGPALGLFQMEPATHDDCWQTWLRYQNATAASLLQVCGLRSPPGAGAMVSNLRYACAMARVKYLRAPAPLPPANDAAALSAYHKQNYNTVMGAANAAHNVGLFQQAIAA
ncbi:MAG: hypothetical protein ABF888_03150 [Acetobacter papayae]